MVEDMKGKIRVYCRVRPMSKAELERVSHTEQEFIYPLVFIQSLGILTHSNMRSHLYIQCVICMAADITHNDQCPFVSQFVLRK